MLNLDPRLAFGFGAVVLPTVLVSAAVNPLDPLTQQNTARIEESAVAADSLKPQADKRVRAVSLIERAA